jgi:hypothetical protein
MAAVALTGASARGLDVDLRWPVFGVVGFGALGVYAFDRWGDRDKPGRVHLSSLWPRLLPSLAVGGVVISVVLAIGLPWRAWGLLAAIAALSLVHRWLQGLPWVKPLYVAVAWLGVVVGVPWALGSVDSRSSLLELIPLGLALLANVLACDAADREAEASVIGSLRVWWIARGLAALGVVCALWFALRFVVVPLCMLLALLEYRPSPRYVAWWVDGALLVGGVLAWVA